MRLWRQVKAFKDKELGESSKWLSKLLKFKVKGRCSVKGRMPLKCCVPVG